MSDLTRLYDLAHEWQYRALASEGREKADHATIADLRSRLALLAGSVCEECGCAEANAHCLCHDCYSAKHFVSGKVGACISVGLRALCGRRILEGME